MMLGLLCRLRAHRWAYIGSDPRFGRREWCRRCGDLRTTVHGALVETVLPDAIEEARERIRGRLFREDGSPIEEFDPEAPPPAFVEIGGLLAELWAAPGAEPWDEDQWRRVREWAVAESDRRAGGLATLDELRDKHPASAAAREAGACGPVSGPRH